MAIKYIQNQIYQRNLKYLKPDTGECVFDGDGFQVRERLGLRWLHFGDNGIQTVISIENPSLLIHPYAQAMAVSVLFVEKPQSILNLGLGSGSFVHFFNENFDNINITAVEANEQLSQMAENYFFLDRSVFTIHHLNAEEFLFESEHDVYDLIIADLFGEQHITELWANRNFYELNAGLVKDEGIFALNVVSKRIKVIHRIVSLIKKSGFNHVLTIPIPEYKNTVILASRYNDRLDSMQYTEAEIERIQENYGINYQLFI